MTGIMRAGCHLVKNQLVISDSGHGLKQDSHSKLFTPFYTTKPIGEGTGLGMAISYTLIEEHDGKIKVDSRLDKGTLVSIYLPLSAT